MKSLFYQQRNIWQDNAIPWNVNSEYVCLLGQRMILIFFLSICNKYISLVLLRKKEKESVNCINLSNYIHLEEPTGFEQIKYLNTTSGHKMLGLEGDYLSFFFFNSWENWGLERLWPVHHHSGLMKERFWSYDANSSLFSMTYLPCGKVLQSFVDTSAAQHILHNPAPSQGHGLQCPKVTVNFP